MNNTSGATVGAIAGMVVGAAVGFFAPPAWGLTVAWGASLGTLAGSLAGSAYDAVNPPEQVQRQESAGDILLQRSAYGETIVQFAGRIRLAGNVIDMGEKVEHEHRETAESGGKGGGPRQVTITKTYTVDLHIGLADTLIFGPVAGIAKAYADNTIIYDMEQSPELPVGWTFYPGIEDEDPDPTFEALHGVGNDTGHPFLARVAMADYNLGTFPRIPNFTFELYQEGAQAAPLTQLLVEPVSGDVWVAAPTLNELWQYNDATGERIAAHRLITEAPAAVSYGWNLTYESLGVLWVSDPITYRSLRFDTGTLTVTHTINSNNSLIGNAVVANGYVWIGTLDYQQVTLNDLYKGVIVAFDENGIAPFTFTQDFKAVRSWLRVTTASDGSVWTFSDADDGDQSRAIRINQVNGSQASGVDLGADKILKDILGDASGNMWVCNFTDNSLVKINVASNTISATIPVGEGPLQAAIASDGYIWVATRGRLVARIDPVTNARQEFPSDLPNVISPNNSIWAQGPGGAMWLVCTDDWTCQRFSTTGETITVRTGASPRMIDEGSGNSVWVCCGSGDLMQIQDDGSADLPANVGLSGLPSVLARLNEAAGLDVTEYDVSSLPNEPVILGLTSIQAVRAPIEQLKTAYNVGAIESNGKLIYKRFGQEPIVVTVPEGDLDAKASQDGEMQGVLSRELAPAELPTVLHLNYVSPTRNYQQNSQMGLVSNSQAPTEHTRVMSTAVGLSDGQAKDRAQQLIDRVWIEATEYQATISRKYAYLEPMDRIKILSRQLEHTLTIGVLFYGRPGLLELQGPSDSSATQYVIGAKPGVALPPGGGLGTLAQTIALLLNLPTLDANDSAIRYHVAYLYTRTGFPGATLHRSLDGGSSYALLHAGTRQVIAGTAVTALPDANPLFTDTVSTVDIRLDYGTLSSVTDAQFDAGAGIWGWLGSEVVYAKNAVLVGPQTYRLSHFYRGMRGTELHTATHAIGDTFVLLDFAVQAVSMTLGERGVTYPYKTVTNGLSLDQVSAATFTPTAKNFELWALFPDVTKSGDDFVFTFYGRNRLGGAWVSGSEAPPDPDLVHYQLDLFSDAGYATLVRSLTLAQGANWQAAQTLTYTGAQQTTDHGAPITTVYSRLYQMGRYGPGEAANALAA